MTNPKGFVPPLCACGCSEPVRKKGARYRHGHHLRVIRDSRPLIPLADRFWAKVQKGPGCWLWTGKRQRDGYGLIRVGRAIEGDLRAHRVSYEINVGPIPPGLHVLHFCDTPPCVRPDHLFVGTPADNARDRTAKGHTQSGANHYHARRRAARVT